MLDLFTRIETQNRNKDNTTGITCGTGTAYPSIEMLDLFTRIETQSRNNNTTGISCGTGTACLQKQL